MNALFQIRNEIDIFYQETTTKWDDIKLKVSKEPVTIQEHSMLVQMQQILLYQLAESQIMLDSFSKKFTKLRDEVKSIVLNSGHCDPVDLFLYLSKGNQNQLALPWWHIILQGESCCFFTNGITNYPLWLCSYWHWNLRGWQDNSASEIPRYTKFKAICIAPGE